jgi:gas vesicle protein
MIDQSKNLGALKPLEPIAVVPVSLCTLINDTLPQLHDAAIALARARQYAARVDGTIIGTGEADFTKGNTLYNLKFKEKNFQLMDVPGIEGDESRYTDLVRQAVAKAHLVFYVNGTNKKPEVATAQKIRGYLCRGTQVYSIVNVRGSADAYEFDEDRVSLGQQGSADEALKQTMGVLAGALSHEVLLGGACIQGLLGFSALAFDDNQKHTTIHPSRDRDLVLQQRNYLKYFGSHKAMCEFSHIKVLEKAHQDHKSFLAKLEPEFKKCKESVEQAIRSCERKSEAGRRSLWGDFFNQLSEKAKDAVAMNFGDNETIESQVRHHFKEEQKKINKKIEDLLKKCLEELQVELQEALNRLLQDVQRVDFQNRPIQDSMWKNSSLQAPKLDMGLGFKGWGKFAFQVGSYAATGATIGSAIPGVGTVIGGIVGALVGALMAVFSLFTSKEKRIRKAQSQLQERIDQMQSDVMGRLNEVNSALSKMFRTEIAAVASTQVEELYQALRRPLPIIEHQIASMNHIQNRLKEMSRGTIQAV